MILQVFFDGNARGIRDEFEYFIAGSNGSLPMEASSVNPDYDPGVGQQDIRLLKQPHIFVSAIRSA
jgi:hypothetical protein